MEKKSWGSKSKTQMRQTQWWHRSRNFAALHVRDYTLHVQHFPIWMSPQLHIQTHPLSRLAFLLFKEKFFVFLRFFFMWIIFKVFIEFVTVPCLFYVLVFWPWGIWDLSSGTRAWTCIPCIGRWSLTHWTIREVRIPPSLWRLPYSPQEEVTLTLLTPYLLLCTCGFTIIGNTKFF